MLKLLYCDKEDWNMTVKIITKNVEMSFEGLYLYLMKEVTYIVINSLLLWTTKIVDNYCSSKFFLFFYTLDDVAKMHEQLCKFAGTINTEC